MDGSAGITPKRLRELLHYDSESGVFTWRQRRRGVVAGYINNDGYRQIQVDGRDYLAHRLAWLHVHGLWPAKQIDHANGCRSDNRLTNLREATHAENQRNATKQANNTSGFCGVCWNARDHKWQAHISAGAGRRHIGYFDTPEAAARAYDAAALIHHGAFARLNFPTTGGAQ